MAAALVIAFYAGKLAGNVRLSAPNVAEGALEQTGLPGEYAPSYALHGAADGRDSFAQTVFCVEREREELLQRMSRTEGWRGGLSPLCGDGHVELSGGGSGSGRRGV